MNEGEPIKWRVHFNQLIARPIPETEFLTIAQRMFDDGLVAVLSLDGLKWFSGRYQVTAKVVHYHMKFYRISDGAYQDEKIYATPSGLTAWLQGYLTAGSSSLIAFFVGEDEK